ncbi:MAG: hypothetical protein JOZ69_07525 [Myxococcales bacterium]|nr:hypothetical protein [Myxococcales bacterium]
MSNKKEPKRIVRSDWPGRWRVALRVLGAAYIAGVWLDGTGTGVPEKILPRVPNYFLQVATLFPHAATASIDYRAEGFVCADKAWRELDTRPYFPINRDDKENRFYRTMHFLRTNRPTMVALETYLVEQHDAGRADDGIPRDMRIGGVRLSSVRIPIPELGTPIERFKRAPLATYPEAERKVFFHTPRSRLAARCGTALEGAD